MKTKSDAVKTEMLDGLSRQHSRNISLYKPKNTFFGIPDSFTNRAYVTDKESEQEVPEEKNADEMKSDDIENEMNADKNDVLPHITSEKTKKEQQKSNNCHER